ncbi:MAG: AAA family ATPase [Sinobacterium sp.]|nr:AAA family ATPase [Sinobacterium sp.]
MSDLQTEQVTINSLFDETYALNKITVFNWGPFHNAIYSADIDANGTAIIGPTGSGKTTIVDAFMTLICQNPKYNLASTGGHESDRSLVSYVRGETGAGKNDGSTDHILRPGKTVSAVEACFFNGERTVRAIGLFWMEGTSNSASDLHKSWIFDRSENTLSLEEIIELQQSGQRHLNQWARDHHGVFIDKSKSAYLSQLKDYFEVGDNAFTLLNRAAGLKQINSIDELFRELVLDDSSKFERANEVVTEFDNLAKIHNELEIAKLQQKSLLPIAQEHEHYLDSLDQQQHYKSIALLSPRWFALKSHELWTREKDRLAITVASASEKVNSLKHTKNNHEVIIEGLNSSYLQAGGQSIKTVEDTIKTQHELMLPKQKLAEQYVLQLQSLRLSSTVSLDSFSSNQLVSNNTLGQLDKDILGQNILYLNAEAAAIHAKNTIKTAQNELALAAQSESNIPRNYLQFQENLAQELNINTESIPFLAQLIEVKQEQASWRGAIERSIGAHRLRLIVPEQYMSQALSWVNRRNNKINVRLFESHKNSKAVNFLNDGFTRKINYKKHPMISAAKKLLSEIDRHCVDSTEALQHTPHGLTEQGMISGKKGYFEKQDAYSLDKGWITGFDNKDRIHELMDEIDQITDSLRSLNETTSTEKERLSLLQKDQVAHQFISDITFKDIDISPYQETIKSLQTQLEALLDPNSDLALLNEQLIAAKETLQSIDTEYETALQENAVLDAELKHSEKLLSDAYIKLGNKLTADEMEHAQRAFSEVRIGTVQSIPGIESSFNLNNQAKLNILKDNLSESAQILVELMGKAKQEDNGPLLDCEAKLADVGDYLERLKILTEEALPEKQKRFLDYLNISSDQSVNQLLNIIDSEVERIRDRIEDLNNTMRRADYKPDRYLQLEPRRVTHDSLNTLKAAQKNLNSKRLVDDEGESHYKALQKVISILQDACEQKKRKGSLALLDPRYRLQFSVSEKDRHTHETLEIRQGSQSGSGGEKELIASYILTASLSYALCPDGSPKPLFGTIVLDEAFSRSSQKVAGRIITALREFGLKPLFITPNKEIKLLREHTRSAILVHNKNNRSSLLSISWEELEKQSQKISAS